MNYSNQVYKLRTEAEKKIFDALDQNQEIVLVDVEKDEMVPDEFYEMPRQHLHRKYDILVMHVVKIYKKDNDYYAHSLAYDDISDEYEFKFSDLSNETIFEIADIL